jgi:hypothetical protein
MKLEVMPMTEMSEMNCIARMTVKVMPRAPSFGGPCMVGSEDMLLGEGTLVERRLDKKIFVSTLVMKMDCRGRNRGFEIVREVRYSLS